MGRSWTQRQSRSLRPPFPLPPPLGQDDVGLVRLVGNIGIGASATKEAGVGREGRGGRRRRLSRFGSLSDRHRNFVIHLKAAAILQPAAGRGQAEDGDVSSADAGH